MKHIIPDEQRYCCRFLNSPDCNFVTNWCLPSILTYCTIFSRRFLMKYQKLHFQEYRVFLLFDPMLNLNNSGPNGRILTRPGLNCSQWVRIWYFNRLLSAKVFIPEVASAPYNSRFQLFSCTPIGWNSFSLVFLEVLNRYMPSERSNLDILSL